MELVLPPSLLLYYTQGRKNPLPLHASHRTASYRSLVQCQRVH